MEKIADRFLRYVSIDTQSKDDMPTIPSTEKQLDLAKLLYKELCDMGIEAKMDEHGYVYGSIHNNNGKEHPVIGFISHMDTAPDASGKDIKVQKVKYEGGDVTLNKDLGIYLSPKAFPYMNEIKGETILCTDGTTLLGADDKAGIAAIMSLAQYIVENPDFKHGEIRIGFTPDEEVGNGATLFDVKGFGADYAYTVDGGTEGEIEYENFNACALKLTVKGASIHTGSAKDVMVNASLIAMEFNSLLPENQKPQYTENYDGFFHLSHMSGGVEEAQLSYIVRDHDAAKFKKKQEIAKAAADFLNQKYDNCVTLEITEQYRNMKEKIEPHMFLIDNLKSAICDAGVEPKIVAIRGGTDGARLSYMGLPCPNMGTGGQNFHGKYEFITVESMERNLEILKNLCQKF